jgi:hypothetical protein
MVLAPRIMRGELGKLPPHYLVSHGSVGNQRTQSDLEKLQGRLATETGIGEDIICDFLHGIPGFTLPPGRVALVISPERLCRVACFRNDGLGPSGLELRHPRKTWGTAPRLSCACLPSAPPCSHLMFLRGILKLGGVPCALSHDTTPSKKLSALSTRGAPAGWKPAILGARPS